MKKRLLIVLALPCFVLMSATIDVVNFLNYANLTVPDYLSNRDNTPANNAITNPGATLGRVLFYDKNLSTNNTIACASCHQQALAFGDDATVSVGLNGGLTERHSMRLAYSRFSGEDRFFWDKRAATLEEQTTQPIQDHVEMGFDGTNGADIDSLTRKLANLDYYQQLFPLAFPDGNITEERIQLALAQFIRSIQSFDSKYDTGRAMVANDTIDFPNFTVEENLGKALYLKRRLLGGASCAPCHNTPTFDLRQNSGNNGVITVAGNPGAKDLTNTRSPSLRDVFNPNGDLNGPLMHDGSFTSMLDVINHYNAIPIDPDNTNIDNVLVRGNGTGQQLNLTEPDKNNLIAFLKTLTSSAIYTDEKWSDPFDEMDEIEVTAAPPNFVVILADDMGWTGSSVAMSNTIADSKSGFYFTPNIDTLIAQKGMTFSQGYAPAPKCSPSRCAILTGQTTARNQFTETGGGTVTNERILTPATNTTIDDADVTIGEWLKSAAGYRTAHYGKWHLGSGGTADNGFDFGDGNTTNNDGDQGGLSQSDPKKIFELSTKAVDFITAAKNDGVPFYLQVSHYAVHSPLEAQQSTIDLYNNASERPNNSNGNHNSEDYGAMTEDMDTGIGQIMQAIQDLGLEGDTYVIFTSDNGAASGQSNNAPLLGGKVHLTEGGIRVPFIVKGPNVPENTYNNTPIVGYDLLPTFAALTGSANPLPVDIDGVNIAPLFLNNSIARRGPMYFHSPHYGNGGKVPVSAAIEGDYKLNVDYHEGTLELYNLATDIGESTDIAADNPSIFNRLRLELRNHLRDANANMPTLNETHADWTATTQMDDADGDGLNDVWEFTQLLTYLDDADGDPDNDGHTNLEEQTAGTDPLVAEEIFACQDTFKLDASTFSGNQNVPASDIIESSRNYTDGTILFTAGESITLKAGFFVAAGTEFIARIEDCTPAFTETESEGATERTNNDLLELPLTEEINTPKIHVYPNPATGVVNIALLDNSGAKIVEKIQLFNLNGTMVLNNINTNRGLDVSNFAKGIYFVRVRLKDSFMIQKLVIQ